MNNTPTAPSSAPTKSKVLLVDDDKFLIDMYAAKFSREGFSVQASLSVNDAIAAIKAGFIPDAIVIDLLMPERDGFSFLRALTEEKLAPQAAKITLTNQSEVTERTRAEGLGADQYIVKASMIPSEVVNVVQKAIEEKRKA